MEQMREAEECYSYYRRCHGFKKSGEQCKAPALKGEPLCYKHAAQQEMRRRWQRQREGLRLPKVKDRHSMLKALGVVAEALMQCRIDGKNAGRLVWELQQTARLRTKLRVRKGSHLASIRTAEGGCATQAHKPGTCLADQTGDLVDTAIENGTTEVCRRQYVSDRPQSSKRKIAVRAQSAVAQASIRTAEGGCATQSRKGKIDSQARTAVVQAFSPTAEGGCATSCMLLTPAELRSMSAADIEKFVKDFMAAPQVQPPFLQGLPIKEVLIPIEGSSK